MQTLIKADIFFFVTTICVVFISIFLIIFLAKLARLLESVRKLTDMIKDKTFDISEDAKEILERIENSFIFNLIFPKKIKSRASRRKAKGK